MLRTALVLGGSGETGGELLKLLVASPVYGKIISVGRRKVEMPTSPGWSKVEQVEVDFDRLQDFASAFQKIDSAFICLGTTRGKAGAEGFVKVDHDYVLAAASLLQEASCPHLHLLTSQGASPSSWLLYPSTKGRAEESVRSLGFPRLTIYRPGLLLCPRRERRVAEAALQWVAGVTDPYHWWSVSSTTVARAMLANSLGEAGATEAIVVLEHRDIVALGSQD